MLYPSGCLNPITLHICLIMFTGRLDTVHCHFRVSVLMRADLTALPLVIQPRCDSLRYPLLADCAGFTRRTSRLCQVVHIFCFVAVLVCLEMMWALIYDNKRTAHHICSFPQ